MQQKHIVVLGAGFGGLEFCTAFDVPDVPITLVDRTNHHLFQPLLYQVATAGLAAPDIAQPIRSILSRHPNVTVLLDRVVDFNLKEKKIILQKGTLTYDYLILALGGCTSYFGHPEWEEFAPGLKSLADAIHIRSRILLAFEKAEMEEDKAEHDRLMTIVVVGGGPTGVELAGAFAELTRHVLRADFRRIDPGHSRVILLEGSPRVLSTFPEESSESARQQLEKLGVHVRLSTRVKNISKGCVELETGEMIHAENIIWAAGVSATPLTQKLGVPIDRAGRVKVEPDLTLPGYPNVFAVGDMAFLLRANGTPVPGVSPAAMQMARYAARVIRDEMTFPEPPTRRPFKYWDKGSMATIGRSAAVAQIGKLEFFGFSAWVAWLFIHLVFLVGFRNKVAVFLQWIYSYLTYKRGARIITEAVRKGSS